MGAVIDVFFFDSYTKMLKNRYEEREQSFHSIKYEEEVTIQYIESVVEIMKKYSLDVIVGIGGGKSIDSAKSVAAGRVWDIRIACICSGSWSAGTCRKEAGYMLKRNQLWRKSWNESYLQRYSRRDS